MGRNQSLEHINEEINKISSAERLLSEVEIENKLALNRMTAYIEADAFIGNPYALLGKVIELRRTNGECPTTLLGKDSQAEFSVNQIIGFEEDRSARLNTPVQRASLVVNQSLAAKVSFLNFLSSQMENSSTFSIVVFDEASGLINTNSRVWTESVASWKQSNQELLEDPDVCYVFAITGFIQKNILRKKYKQFQVGAQGGAYGLNLEGKLYTSTEDFSLDIRFGLTPAILKRPTAPKSGFGMQQRNELTPSKQEKLLFGSLTGFKKPN